MNIAFTTLIILLLLLPGIFFSRFYYSGEFSKQYFKSTIFELILSTFIQSILLHVFWVYICSSLGFSLNYYLILSLISGIEDTDHLKEISKLIQPSINRIVYYNITLWIVASFLGSLGRFLVRKLKLDRKFTILRYQNDWHYLLSGEMLDFPNVDGQTEQVDVISLDILVDSAEGGIIYSGILNNYVLSKAGGLELINLRNATRRFLSNVKHKTSKQDPYFKLEGNVFTILYSNIQNIHITYVRIDDLSEQNDDQVNNGKE